MPCDVIVSAPGAVRGRAGKGSGRMEGRKSEEGEGAGDAGVGDRRWLLHTLEERSYVIWVCNFACVLSHLLLLLYLSLSQSQPKRHGGEALHGSAPTVEQLQGLETRL